MLTLHAKSFTGGLVDWFSEENGQDGIYLSEHLLSVFNRKPDAHAYLYARYEGRAFEKSRRDPLPNKKRKFRLFSRAS